MSVNNKESNIIPIPDNISFNPQQVNSPTNRVIIKENDQDGGTMKSENNFITSKDLKNMEEKTDLKLEKINSEIDGKFNTLNATINGNFNSIDNKFDLVNSKFDNLEKNIENMFLKSKNETLEREKKETKETRRWIVGTGIAVIGLVFTLIKFFV